VKEYDLDWYEKTKLEGECAFLSERGRLLRIECVIRIDRSVWKWREAQRLQKHKQQRLLPLVAEMEQTRSEVRAVARALQPVRRSARLSGKNRT
jgi:hypothetical protein